MRIVHLAAAASMALTAPATAHAYRHSIVNTASAAAAACPAFEIGAASEQLWGSEIVSEPAVFDVIAGGDIDLGECAQLPGFGYVVAEPDFTLSLRGLDALAVEFYVTGDCDTVLLVNAADGSWHYSDDFEDGFDPLVEIADAPSGQYDIWVGTYDQDACEATLFVGAYDPLLVS